MRINNKLESISEFYRDTEKSFWECMESSDPIIQIINEINLVFVESLKLLAVEEILWESFFLRRSSSLFLSSVRIGCGGQSSDVYPLLRTMLESALYVWYIRLDSTRLNVWLERMNNTKSRKEMRATFSYGKIMEEFQEKHQAFAKVIKCTYEFHIDFGAHPNFSSILSGIKEIGTSKIVDYSFKGNQNDNSFQLALERTAQAGVESLEIFRLTFPQQFKQLGLDLRILTVMQKIDILLKDNEQRLNK